MRLISAFTSDTDKALWRLALPMIFSNITVPLLGLVDTAVIGHLDSPIYLGGVAIGAVATSFLFMLLLFLRMSTTGLAAQALGAQNPQALARAFMQPLLLALLAGGAIVLLRYPLIELALRIVGGDGGGRRRPSYVPAQAHPPPEIQHAVQQVADDQQDHRRTHVLHAKQPAQDHHVGQRRRRT